MWTLYKNKKQKISKRFNLSACWRGCSLRRHISLRECLIPARSSVFHVLGNIQAWEQPYSLSFGSWNASRLHTGKFSFFSSCWQPWLEIIHLWEKFSFRSCTTAFSSQTHSLSMDVRLRCGLPCLWIETLMHFFPTQLSSWYSML